MNPSLCFLIISLSSFVSSTIYRPDAQSKPLTLIPVSQPALVPPVKAATKLRPYVSQSQSVVKESSVDNVVSVKHQQSIPLRSFGEPIQVPVITTHDLRLFPVNVEPSIPQPSQVIAVEPTQQAVHLVFKSVSSPVSVQQQHQPGERSFYETTRSEEPPHVIRHEVFKPVVQELRETIQPYRQVTQEIRPVIEKVNVLIPKQQQSVVANRHLIQSHQQQLQQQQQVENSFIGGQQQQQQLWNVASPRQYVVQQSNVQQQFTNEQINQHHQQQQQQAQRSLDQYTVPIIIEHHQQVLPHHQQQQQPIIVQQQQQRSLDDVNDDNFD